MLPGQLLNCRRTACKAHKLFVDGCARNASSTMVESGRAVFVPRLGHLRTLTSSRRSAQQQQHPLARRPTLGNASNGSGRTSSNPRLSDGKQTWSTATALLLATMTGATTYVLGTTASSSSSSSSSSAVSADGRTPKPKPPAQEDFEKAFKELKSSLPEECVSTERDDLIMRGGSTWTYHDPLILPGAVLFPRHTEDVVKIMKTAYKYAIPVVAYSGGTSLEGHFDAPSFTKTGAASFEQNGHHQKIPVEELKTGPTLVVDFGANMNEIVAVHERDMDVVVQPGMPYEQLNEELKEKGLFFPVDPGPGAEIGGMVGTGCSGTNAVRYGTMRENVLNLTVVLANGEVIKTRSRARKSSAGPDLTKLFIGSEGTLGLVVEATLRLQPLLPTSVAVSSFPNIEKAADTVKEVVQNGILVQCIEILDDLMMKAINQSEGKTPGAKQWPETPSLFFKFNGSEEQIKLDMKRTADIVKRNQGTRLITASTEKDKEALWQARKVALWSALEYVPGSRCWTTDVCVPISNFPTLIKETKEDLVNLNVIAPICGHAGDGNFHGLLMFRDEEELARVKEGVHRMIERAQRLEGTCTGEHGVGHGKMKYLVNELGEGTLNVLRKIKRELDPKNIMNPQKLVSVEYEGQ